MLKKRLGRIAWVRRTITVVRSWFKDLYPKKCACCRNRFKSYLPISDRFEDNQKKYGVVINGKSEMLNKVEYQCPICGSTDRDRAYALYMKKELNPKEKLFILDIAPNKGLKKFIRSYFPNSDYKTADLYKKNVDLQLDIMDMSIIEAHSVDLFICSHVLEHVRDDIQAMKELRRVLKEGRTGICVVPIDLTRTEIDEDPDCDDVGERWRRFGQHDHVRAYSKQGYIDRLKSVGFDVLEYNSSFFTEQEMKENGLADTSTVYIVS